MKQKLHKANQDLIDIQDGDLHIWDCFCFESARDLVCIFLADNESRDSIPPSEAKASLSLKKKSIYKYHCSVKSGQLTAFDPVRFLTKKVP
jgi:hypothetical protein